MRKNPPYAKRVSQSIQEGYSNCLYMFIGYDAWERARNFTMSRPTLLLPPYEDPSLYKWPVEGYEVLVLEREAFDDEFLNDLAYWLYEDCATKVTVWRYPDGKSLIFEK